MSGQEERVIDRNPFESIYDCGKAGSFKNLERELNTMIAAPRSLQRHARLE